MDWECEECGHFNESGTPWNEGVKCEKCGTEFDTEYEEHWDGVECWITGRTVYDEED